jgi:3-phenylpropionate/trans-cinnamate dioxygenase ferredoxin subunit
MTEWIKLCELKEINNSEMKDFDLGAKKILLARIDHDIYATDRICTHAYADLTLGFLNEEQKTITCPLHMSIFRLQDGIPENLPAEEPLKTYKTKIEDGWIYVMLE